MSTSAAVWRGTLTDWVREALGHARADEAPAIVDALVDSGLADLRGLREAQWEDLVQCGCPADVAQNLLDALGDGGYENEPQGYYEIGPDPVPHSHPVADPNVANSFSHRDMATHDKKAFGFSKAVPARKSTQADKHPGPTAEYWELGVDTVPTGAMQQSYRVEAPHVDKRAFGPGSKRMSRTTTGRPGFSGSPRRKQPPTTWQFDNDSTVATPSLSASHALPPRSPPTANGASTSTTTAGRNGTSSRPPRARSRPPKAQKAGTRSGAAGSKGKPYSEMATPKNPKPSPARGGWDSTTTDHSRYRRTEEQQRRRFRNFNERLTTSRGESPSPAGGRRSLRRAPSPRGATKRHAGPTPRADRGSDLQTDSRSDPRRDSGGNATLWDTARIRGGEGGTRDPDRVTFTGSASTRTAVERLVEGPRRVRHEAIVGWVGALQLGRPDTPVDAVVSAAAHLMEAARTDEGRGVMIQAGVLPWLKAQLESGIPDVVGAAAGCVGNLSDGGRDIRRSMRELEIVEVLGAAMETSDHNTLEKCIGALRNLMVSSDQIRACAVGADIHRKLVTALTFDDPRVQEEAAGALKNMGAGDPTHAETLTLETDACRELARLLLSDSVGVREQAEGALAHLARGVHPPSAGGPSAHPVLQSVMDVVRDAKDNADRLRDEVTAERNRPDESAALKAKVWDLTQQLDKATAEAAGAADRIADADRRAEQAEAAAAAAAESKQSVEQALYDAAGELDAARAELHAGRDAAHEATAELARNADTIETLEITIAGLEARVAELEQQVIEASRRRGSAKTRRTPPVGGKRSSTTPSPGFGSSTPRNIGDLTKERLAASQPQPRGRASSTATFVVSGSEQSSPARSSPPSVTASPEHAPESLAARPDRRPLVLQHSPQPARRSTHELEEGFDLDRQQAWPSAARSRPLADPSPRRSSARGVAREDREDRGESPDRGSGGARGRAPGQAGRAGWARKGAPRGERESPALSAFRGSFTDQLNEIQINFGDDEPVDEDYAQEPNDSRLSLSSLVAGRQSLNPVGDRPPSAARGQPPTARLDPWEEAPSTPPSTRIEAHPRDSLYPMRALNQTAVLETATVAEVPRTEERKRGSSPHVEMLRDRTATFTRDSEPPRTRRIPVGVTDSPATPMAGGATFRRGSALDFFTSTHTTTTRKNPTFG
eukprot:m.222643 g.222643  ORF g.222643 m.222643 type:complete len:1176 (-) comp15628_c0_seq2:1259-4786(-)